MDSPCVVSNIKPRPFSVFHHFHQSWGGGGGTFRNKNFAERTADCSRRLLTLVVHFILGQYLTRLWEGQFYVISVTSYLTSPYLKRLLNVADWNTNGMFSVQLWTIWCGVTVSWWSICGAKHSGGKQRHSHGTIVSGQTRSIALIDIGGGQQESL